MLFDSYWTGQLRLDHNKKKKKKRGNTVMIIAASMEKFVSILLQLRFFYGF